MDRIATIKKIIAWLAGFSGIAFLLVLLALLLSPFWLNQELVKNTLIKTISEQWGGNLKYSKIDTLLLPKPHLILHRSQYKLRDRIEGSIDSIEVYPKIIPLIKGQIEIARIRVNRPAIKIVITDQPPHPAMSIETVPAILGAMNRFLSRQSYIKANASFELNHGQLSVGNRHQPHLFEGIRAKLRYHRHFGLAYSVHCTSSLWDRLFIKGRIQTNTAKGSGQLKCLNLRPHRWVNRLLSDRLLRVTDSRLDLALKYRTDSASNLSIEADIAVPQWTFKKGTQEASVKIGRFNSVFNLTPRHATLSFADLNLTEPALLLSGNLIVNRQKPNIRLDLSSIGVDATGVRKTVLALAGDVPQVQEVFNIIKAGQLPTLRLNATGRTWSDLTLIRNYLVKGRMTNGRIFIPGPDLDLEQVTGDAEIAGGVLRGEGLSARMGNSTGKDGQLTLGLIADAAPFWLDIQVDADVSQLPPVLQRQIPNDAFRREMSGLKIITGQAVGQLTLAESNQSIRPTVQVFSADLLADYHRIPYPVHLKIGAMQYQNRQIRFDIPEAMVGDSILANLTVGVDWRQSPQIDISTQNADIQIREALACLNRALSISEPAESLQIHQGTASINRFQLKGPAQSIRHWKIDTAGIVREAQFDWTATGDPVTVEWGAFEIQSSGAGPDARTDVRINWAELQWGPSHIGLKGTMAVSDRIVQLDVDATTDNLDAVQLEPLDRMGAARWQNRLAGHIRMTADRFTYEGQTWQQLHADITLAAAQTVVKVNRANLCGISTTGMVTFLPDSIQLEIFPIATDQSISAALDCLLAKDNLITGRYTLSGQLLTAAPSDQLTRKLTGSLAAVAESGRIYRYTALSKILALLNITEVVKGKLPDLTNEGFAYKSISAKADIRNGELFVPELIIDGASMTIVALGKYNLINRKLRFTVLVAPLKTIDSIIQNLPFTNLVFGNTLVSFPFLIKGTPDQHEVATIGPAAVPPALSKVLNRTLKGPIQIINPKKAHRTRNIDK